MYGLDLKRETLIYVSLAIVLLIVTPLNSVAEKIKTAEEHFLEGNEHYGKADYQGALESYTKAIELKPRFAEAYYARGATYAMLGQIDLAIKDFDKILEIDPSDVDAYYNKGFTYEIIGKNEEAIEQYKLFIEKANFQTVPELIEKTKRKINKLERKLKESKKTIFD